MTLALLVACVDDIPTIEVTAMAGVATSVATPDDGIPVVFGHYDWKLVELPPGATDPEPTQSTATLSILPSMRGIYVYDRWFVTEVAAQLSYHVVVTVMGVPPIARPAGPTTAAVGEATTFDGSTSTSAEGHALEFQWRLARRPEGSTALLPDADDATTMLVPDVAGDYQIELRVFDGELWSSPVALVLGAR